MASFMSRDEWRADMEKEIKRYMAPVIDQMPQDVSPVNTTIFYMLPAAEDIVMSAYKYAESFQNFGDVPNAEDVPFWILNGWDAPQPDTNTEIPTVIPGLNFSELVDQHNTEAALIFERQLNDPQSDKEGETEKLIALHQERANALNELEKTDMRAFMVSCLLQTYNELKEISKNRDRSRVIQSLRDEGFNIEISPIFDDFLQSVIDSLLIAAHMWAITLSGSVKWGTPEVMVGASIPELEPANKPIGTETEDEWRKTLRAIENATKTTDRPGQYQRTPPRKATNGSPKGAKASIKGKKRKTDEYEEIPEELQREWGWIPKTRSRSMSRSPPNTPSRNGSIGGRVSPQPTPTTHEEDPFGLESYLDSTYGAVKTPPGSAKAATRGGKGRGTGRGKGKGKDMSQFRFDLSDSSSSSSSSAGSSGHTTGQLSPRTPGSAKAATRGGKGTGKGRGKGIGNDMSQFRFDLSDSSSSSSSSARSSGNTIGQKTPERQPGQFLPPDSSISEQISQIIGPYLTEDLQLGQFSTIIPTARQLILKFEGFDDETEVTEVPTPQNFTQMAENYESRSQSEPPGPWTYANIRRANDLRRLQNLDDRAVFILDLLQLNIDLSSVVDNSSDNVGQQLVQEGYIARVNPDLKQELRQILNRYSQLAFQWALSMVQTQRQSPKRKRRDSDMSLGSAKTELMSDTEGSSPYSPGSPLSSSSSSWYPTIPSPPRSPGDTSYSSGQSLSSSSSSWYPTIPTPPRTPVDTPYSSSRSSPSYSGSSPGHTPTFQSSPRSPHRSPQSGQTGGRMSQYMPGTPEGGHQKVYDDDLQGYLDSLYVEFDTQNTAPPSPTVSTGTGGGAEPTPEPTARSTKDLYSDILSQLGSDDEEL